MLAAALLAVLVMPLAFAGAAKGPEASASASTRQQLKKLKQRVAFLETQGGKEATPSGPAGGDLAGKYPEPTIRANAVRTNEVAPDSLNGLDIASAAIGSSELQGDSVRSIELATDSVGANELKGLSAVVGAGVGVGANASGTATVTCPAGQMVIGGGFAWLQDENGTAIIDSAPSEADPSGTWVVTGRAETSSNTLFPWATCLGI